MKLLRADKLTDSMMSSLIGPKYHHKDWLILAVWHLMLFKFCTIVLIFAKLTIMVMWRGSARIQFSTG